ncbi:thioredoxin-like protein [Sphaerulina musiva SO2202]|uniref:Thioredoxin-like protein n=1 Tax=Sphaerulina musiva (strain SO2202) TaxID=692275 RepID=M3BRF8_SPHMS|nr:thioredoxin-like protein [Sphaerulina musiva SO2202]EMF08708.1 thioredoxin-like protein [Sphaerulina musiva SO2202]
MSHNPGPIVEFYYDISCPYAYIASTKISSLASRTSAHIIWRPVLLGAIYRATLAPQGAGGSASDIFNSTKKSITSRALQRTITRHGIPFRQPKFHPQKTTAALRLVYFVRESWRERLTRELFRLYWVENVEGVGRKEVLRRAVERCEFDGRGDGDDDGDGEEVKRVLKAIEDGSFEGEEQRRQLEISTDLAVQRGAPGVPSFWIPEEIWRDSASTTNPTGESRKGRLYWGQDRMHFVEAVLLGLNNTSQERQSGDTTTFDQALGWTQLASLHRRFNNSSNSSNNNNNSRRNLTIDMKPFLLGILFREIGAPNVPMQAMSEQKRKYMQRDHGDWVRWWNAVSLQEGREELDGKIEFQWPENFPIRTTNLLRAVLVEERLCGVLYRACWERNLNMSDDKVLKQVIAEAGFDADAILQAANEEKIKQELRLRTQEAKDAGICGVPTYRVFRRKLGQGESDWKQFGDLVWGQDEIAVVEDLIAGWDGTTTTTTTSGVENSSSSSHSKL